MTKAKFNVEVDMQELTRLFQKVEATPREIAAYMRKTAIPKAAATLTHAWYMSVPIGRALDRSKQSKKHKAKWAGVPSIVSAIDSAVRPWNRVDTSLYVGISMGRDPKVSPGSKMFFDYMGTTNRQMSFWSGPAGGPKRYRARTRTKRWIARDINERFMPGVVSMMADEFVKGFEKVFKK